MFDFSFLFKHGTGNGILLICLSLCILACILGFAHLCTLFSRDR